MKTKKSERERPIEERWYTAKDKEDALRAISIRNWFIETTVFWIKEYTKQQAFAIQNNSHAEAEHYEELLKIERRHEKQARYGESIS